LWTKHQLYRLESKSLSRSCHRIIEDVEVYDCMFRNETIPTVLYVLKKKYLHNTFINDNFISTSGPQILKIEYYYLDFYLHSTHLR
jgi:hypothetical protein